jgi:hypothetical protein
MTTQEDTTPKKAAAPVKRRKSPDETKQLRKQITSLLNAFEEQIKTQAMKVSVSDFIRLLQIRREFEEQKPKDIEVTWVDSLKEKNVAEK